MLKYLLVLATAFTLNAQESPKTGGPDPVPPQLKGDRPRRPQLTEEQKKQRYALIAKYDTDKNGTLDKEERAKVSEEDRKKLRSFGPPPRRGPKKDGGPQKEQ